MGVGDVLERSDTSYRLYTKGYSVILNLLKIIAVKRHTYFELKKFLSVVPQVCCLFSVKFGIVNLLIILWII